MLEKNISPGAPTIVIVGPTGSGKTGVSIEIAKEIGGEIISADSRAIYKGMDIGTAKPTRAEMQGIPHYGLDLVEPGDRFTVADWKSYAESKIAEIRQRGKLPMVVGGTGLYVDALVFDYQFGRAATAATDVAKQKNYPDRTEVKDGFIIIGIQTDPAVLRERLKHRADEMFSPALYDETSRLVAQNRDWNSQAMKSNIYQFAWAYMQGKISLERAKELFVYDDWHLAKRQMTWFKRSPAIIWLPLEEVLSQVLAILHDYRTQ